VLFKICIDPIYIGDVGIRHPEIRETTRLWCARMKRDSSLAAAMANELLAFSTKVRLNDDFWGL